MVAKDATRRHAVRGLVSGALLMCAAPLWAQGQPIASGFQAEYGKL